VNQTDQDGIVVLGAAAHPLRDLYHSLLRMSWWGVLSVIAGVFLAMNVVFAAGYTAVGGITGARPGSLQDAFFFSVQTMGTIGYGAMYPASTAAHTLVVAESVVGVILTALATGMVFARFSQTKSEIIFSNRACISLMNGVPTLSLRIGNDRASTVFEAHVRMTVVRTERTTEGVTLYRLYDVELVRDRSPALARSWNVMHTMTEKSPLFGATPESCVTDEVEIIVTVSGTDDTSLQPVHGRHRYLAEDILWGARLADVLSELPDGRLQLDVRRFQDLVPTQPTAAFPYPKPPGGAPSSGSSARVAEP
jgi:inward rectifier potassium channel